MIASTLRAFVLSLALVGLAACSSGGVGSFISNTFGGDDDAGETLDDDGRISILSFEQTLEIDAPAQAAVQLPTAYVNTSWTQTGGFETHTLHHPEASGPLIKEWSRSIGKASSTTAWIGAQPVIDNGIIFVIDGRQRVSALDIANEGRTLWSVRLRSGRKRDRYSFGGGLAAVGGRLYVSSGYGFVAALDAETGDELWRTENAVPFHSAPSVADGRVFATTDDNELYAFDAITGDVLWSYQGLVESARLFTTPAPAVANDLVIAPFASGELVALQVSNGRVIWQDALTRTSQITALSTLNDIAGSPVISGDVVYAVSHSGVLAALDLRTGERLWDKPAGGINMPWIAGDYIFVVTVDAEVVCLSRHDGSIYWITELRNFKNDRKRKNRVAWAGPILAGGRLMLVSSEGDVRMLIPETGEIYEAFDLGDDVFVPPIIADETVFMLTDEASLIALR